MPGELGRGWSHRVFVGTPAPGVRQCKSKSDVVILLASGQAGVLSAVLVVVGLVLILTSIVESRLGGVVNLIKDNRNTLRCVRLPFVACVCVFVAYTHIHIYTYQWYTHIHI